MELVGTMAALVHAVPVIVTRTGRRVIIIGGLAVICRLTRPYRATSDLDIVHRRSDNEPAQLELLLASGAEASGVSGVLVPTVDGDVQVDVLEVSDAELASLPEDLNDRLHVLSHAWAADTASHITIRVGTAADLTVAVAEPGPLIAMKLQSIMNRGAAKEATEPRSRLRRPPACRRVADRRPDHVSLTQSLGRQGRQEGAQFVVHLVRPFLLRPVATTVQ